MNEHLARQVVAELTAHVVQRLSGLPIATVNTVTGLVFRWLRAEQPEVIDALSAEGVRLVVEDAAR